MKKRLLITSIVMMLVVAVALSTATYAWFTSNATVTADSITLKADTSSATALGIGWADGEASTSISANVSGVLSPMAPVALTDGTTTAGSGASDIAFYTQTTKNEASVYVFNAAGVSATPITFGNGTKTAFYVKNLSNANRIGSITIEAVFENNGKTYEPIMTENIAIGDYYTKSNDAFIKHSTDTAIANTNFTAATGNAVANTDYYQLSAGTYSKVEVEVGDSVSSYYTFTATNYAETTTANASLTGNDLVRVAIFRKSATTSGSYKTYTSGDYKLIGVLGNANTAYNVATGIEAFEKNTTYYTESAGVYTQVPANAAFDGGKTYYTAANTAVYGTISADGAVKDLLNHKVSTSLELITDGDLNSLAQVDLMAIAWLDGSKFDDTRAGEVASVTLKFSA